MNHLSNLRLSRNIYKPLKKISKGGAGLPHNDPPNFKSIKGKRYNTITDHVFWFRDSYEQQYHVIKKHNQFKGLAGMAWNMFRYYFLGTLVPVGIYLMIKDYAHDQTNYYNGYFIENPLNPDYKRNSNLLYNNDLIRETLSAHKEKDVLGRRGQEYYHVLSNISIDPMHPIAVEEKHQQLVKMTPAGRGA